MYLIFVSFIFSWQIVCVYKQKVIYVLNFYFCFSQININKDHALIWAQLAGASAESLIFGSNSRESLVERHVVSALIGIATSKSSVILIALAAAAAGALLIEHSFHSRHHPKLNMDYSSHDYQLQASAHYTGGGAILVPVHRIRISVYTYLYYQELVILFVIYF